MDLFHRCLNTGAMKQDILFDSMFRFFLFLGMLLKHLLALLFKSPSAL